MTVGYTRLSFDKYEDHLGVTRQREDIVALAKALGWPDVTEFYEDNDISANTDKRKARPEFDRLLRDMAAGTVTHALCYDQDRLVRDMRQLEDVVDAVEAGRVMLTSVNGDIDLRSDNGRMVARIKAAVARNELEKLSRRTRRQKLQRAQAGYKQSTRFRTFGYERDFTVVPAEAAVLRKMFKRAARGETLSSLARWLNRTGVVGVSGRTGTWRASEVSTLLQRVEYVGLVTLRGEIIGPANFKAIIDRDVFDEVAARRAPIRAWRSDPERGLLTGLLVCGVCQNRMRRGRGNHTLQSYSCSRCATNKKGNQLSTAVDPTVVQEVAAKIEQIQSTGAWRSADVATIEGEIQQAHRRHAKGSLTSNELTSVLKHLRERLEEERLVVAGLTGHDPDQWKTWDLDARREWLATVVNRIEVAKADGVERGALQWHRVTIFFKDGDAKNLARRRVSADDVAELTGFSRKTVTCVLNDVAGYPEPTRQRILAAVEELGYDQHWRRRPSDL